MMFQAIKTKEDWENLFGKASEQIIVQRDTIHQQLEMINTQKAEILHQKGLLDNLDKEITAKVKTLDEKQKVLDTQFVQISKQKGEISIQKRTIIIQQSEVQVQKDTLTRQREKIMVQLARIDDQLKRISKGLRSSLMQLKSRNLFSVLLFLHFFWSAFLVILFTGDIKLRKRRIQDLRRRTKQFQRKKTR